VSAPSVAWRKRSAFSEVAEALGIDTVDVVAMWSRTGETTDALYKRPDDPTMILATLRRDADGIMRRDVPDTVTDLTVESMILNLTVESMMRWLSS
jgi:hypothetical protein